MLSTKTDVDVKQIPINKIKVINRMRRTDDNNVADLICSIKEIGLLHPICVAQKDDGYLLLSGLHRKIAMEQLGEEYIKVAVVDKPTTEDHSLIQYHENMFRVEMSLFEQVDGLRKIASENPKITYAELSARFGKGVSWISSRM